MGLRPSLKRKGRHSRHLDPDLNITPFIDILVCLILFLLVTAVLGKASIMNLYLPTEEEAATTEEPPTPSIIPTVAVTFQGFILSRAPGEMERIPKTESGYDFAHLQTSLVALRSSPGYSNNVIILPEGRLHYQTLITTMDTVREFRDPDGKVTPLFPVISLGEFRENVPESAAPEKRD